ncbi:hypothetical protein PhCBS80983_g00647 [Powellomyces hirtus]|uniref:Spindle pole body component n=1 Tax=Powellomyces hirtus TaxID=109895 RepID=A0A507EG02_9FUNG|nr:hypothetical protein PhCBS80983_g00647 [Powellomyces hirtus]
MLHELLLTLAGHPGDIFVPYPASPAVATTYVVAHDFPFLHSAERTALNRLAQLGFYYAGIRAFVDRNRKHVWGRVLNDKVLETHTCLRPGYYLLALCTGLDELLDEYVKVIVDTETKVLSNLDVDTDGGRTPLSYFSYVFGKYQILFPQLHELLRVIEAHPDDHHGARLLNILHTSCNSGLSEICMAVFYKQLIAWMLYGRLNDPYHEFFVATGNKDNGRSWNGRDDEVELQLQSDYTRWQSQFKFDASALPQFIPATVADTVLFVGKAIVTINESKRPETARAASLVTKHLETLSGLSKSAVYRPLAFETAVTQVKKDVAAILWDVVVMDEHLLSHLQAFKECYMLGSGDLWMAFIEECAKLKMKAASRLSLVTDHELNTTFRMLLRKIGSSESAFYAEHFRFRVLRSAGNGVSPDFDQQLIGGCFRLDYIVKWPLDLVFTQSDIDKYNRILAFLLKLKSTHMRVQRICSSISQSVRVSNAGARRRTSHQAMPAAEMPRELWQLRAMMMFFLDCLWSYIQDAPHTTQMDVLESNYQLLLKQVMGKHVDQSVGEGPVWNVKSDSDTNDQPMNSQVPNTMEGRSSNPASTEPSPAASPAPTGTTSTASRPDFEYIQTAHQSHVDAVLRGCFLDSVMMQLVGRTIRDAMALCEQFCGIVDRILSAGPWGSSEQEQDAQNMAAQMGQIRDDFESHTSFLFRTFSGAQGTSGQAQMLSQLLLRMDYNKWFSIQRQHLQLEARGQAGAHHQTAEDGRPPAFHLRAGQSPDASRIDTPFGRKERVER